MVDIEDKGNDGHAFRFQNILDHDIWLVNLGDSFPELAVEFRHIMEP